MKFTPSTLSAAARNFRRVLDRKGMALPLNKNNDLLAQILFCKNYSESMAQARQQGFISVMDTSSEEISAAFNYRNRDVSPELAVEIRAETIKAT